MTAPIKHFIGIIGHLKAAGCPEKTFQRGGRLILFMSAPES